MSNSVFGTESETVYDSTKYESDHSIHIYLHIKRMLEFLISFFAIIVLIPVFVVISVAIKADSKGAAIYTQPRVGKSGKHFTLYKFRTMVEGAENLEDNLTPELIEKYKRDRKLENDPRVTSLGSVLRKTSLDELPQIYNVLRGEMSFIGPRPILPEEIEMYGESYRLYTTVLPGLTGLWQVESRQITTMSERAKRDVDYIKNMGAFNDMQLFIRTIGAVITKKGAC